MFVLSFINHVLQESVFTIKGPIVFSALQAIQSVTANQFCNSSMEAAIGDVEMNEYGCVPIKLYL